MADYQSSDEDSQYSDQEYSDDYLFEEPDSKLVSATAKGPTIKVITRDTLSTAQDEDLSTIMDLLLVEKHQARRLLIFHRWDKEELARTFVEKGKASLLAEAGVSEKVHGDSGSSVASSMTCEICFEVVPCSETTRMDCGHCFCNDCWTRYFIVNINEGQSKHIKCMAPGCKYYCNEDVVRRILREENCDMAEKFERFLLESYIEDNRRAKWCPSTPHCGNAICVEDDDVLLLYEVECSCGFQFCFKCLSEPHSPCSCLMRERWAEKSNGAGWLNHNTEPCPKCDRLVYKSEGCKSVICICGRAFRWRAGGRKEKAGDANRDKSQFTRYHKAHMNSLLKGSRFTEAMGNMAPYLGDNCWVNEGYFTLVRSWRVLSYSYPFAFYLFNEERLDMETRIKCNLFEYHLKQLKKNLKKLSKIFKELFKSDEVSDIKMQVINLSAVIDKFCEYVYEFIQEDLLRSLPHRIAPYQLLKPRPQ
ncbi:hypothetical protein QN277_005116 [Acacia crassicarpa]|uniref:RBR-type E3 ubiquitin transferase n=1 Tax=Acacia crassicarpa TaxID=499986 RepID=A0AAE1IWD4_9FABA|nr:hypothetical protein QN277_005116 [Acacia crassicarpa]